MDRQADTTMSILIADDHAIVRRGLIDILVDAFPGAQFSEASNGDEVLSQLLISQPNVLLLDINMPGRSGFEVLKEVKSIYPHLPVIIVSAQPENQYALPCMRAGSTDYVNKINASEELVPAIDKILKKAPKSERNPNLK
jgi:DNA-binding NarL/FixJ family response regulator